MTTGGYPADLLASGHSAADGDRSGDRFVGEADTVAAQDHYRTVGESFGKDHGASTDGSYRLPGPGPQIDAPMGGHPRFGSGGECTQDDEGDDWRGGDGQRHEFMPPRIGGAV